MKCPKCHYLSFDPEPRCRNCGFTLVVDEPDVPMSSDRPVKVDDPIGDLALYDAESVERPLADRPLVTRPDPFTATDAPATPAMREAMRAEPTRKISPARGGGVGASVTVDVVPSRPAATSELPLFVKELPLPEPVAETAVPPPIVAVKPTPVVRSAAPAMPAMRERRPEARKLGPLDDDLLDVLNRIDRREKAAPAIVRDVSDRAGHGQRFGAAAVDAVFIGVLSTAVIAMTLRWCGLGWTDWQALPRLPIGAFLLILLLGYLLLFTSLGGQTIGKMAFAIRVVDAGETGMDATTLGAGQALYREVIAVPSTLAVGLGFLPALFGEGRAVHDRLASTRVIRA